MYAARLKLFARSLALVDTHNRRKDVLWTTEINKFSDRTEAEKREYFGYKRTGKLPQAISLLETETNKTKTLEGTAQSIDFRDLETASFIVDQGGCGSCWAVAAASVLEMRAELASRKKVPKLSYGQLRDCAPNPRHCGGTGGCEGATAELAFDFAKKNGGIAAESDYHTHVGDHKCPTTQPRSTVKLSGWRTLPQNNLAMLQKALNDGPVAVSVDATPLSNYAGGVFHGCGKDATINHAVTAVGYGKESRNNVKYWLIRNSWGETWGESGYFRIMKHDSDEGHKGHCGTDYNPKEGVGCDGGPKTMPVCGMCGILSDSAIPTGVQLLSSAEDAELSSEKDTDQEKSQEDAGEEEEEEAKKEDADQEESHEDAEDTDEEESQEANQDKEQEREEEDSENQEGDDDN
eukprot:TRINITY_DN264_c1_g1_i1.p1 TRINITY_DN264_c1_g1~~TRINITY_DN264_c1_g1_i1.p1  ORF type:complete len:474 (-),score=110.97 TRINITY_DN264_c1_g1_i1:163-1380(-)